MTVQRIRSGSFVSTSPINAATIDARTKLKKILDRIEFLDVSAHPSQNVRTLRASLLDEAATLRTQVQSANDASLSGALKKLLDTLEENGNSQGSQDIFHALPIDAKHELYYFAWLASGAPSEDGFGEKALKHNPMLLLQITGPWAFPHGKHLLEQYIQLTQERRDVKAGKTTLELHRLHQYESFKALFNHPEVAHRQLRHAYKRLDPEVRKDQPAPPYYGHGVRADLYNTLGAHPNKEGTAFRVFAPHAKSVQVAIKDKQTGKDYAALPMKGPEKGVWELQGDKIEIGTVYEYIIETLDNKYIRKADPFAFANKESHEVYFHHESIVSDIDKFVWKDEAWMKNRAASAPINIFEVHPTLWKKKEGGIKNFRQLAEELVKYCSEMGFTHVELMGILDHPNEGSMGYQATGYFSPNFRLGSPEDFQFLVDFLHRNKIGVILDWVPSHFAIDDFGLKNFDGTALYEHPNRMHPTWKTHCFNYAQKEVRDFLISSALFWLDKKHVDGLRVDAVEWMLKGASAKLLLRDLNALVHSRFPGALVIAEDMGTTPRLTHSLSQKGVGFDAKWHAGFLHHILKYMRFKVEDRPANHKELIQSLKCDTNERVVIPFSHDLIPLVDMMPEDDWRKRANTRLLTSMAVCLPGMKLIYEKHIEHPDIRKSIQTINHIFIKTAAFWENDQLLWLDNQDEKNCVISYLRKDNAGKAIACVHNFSANYFEEYIINSPHLETFKSIKEIFNSDAKELGGSGRINTEATLLKPHSIKIQLPPLATAIFQAN